LKQTTIPSFKTICPQSFIKNYNQETQTVTFRNDSQIIFFSENYDEDKELNRWKGLEVSGFFLEECNELNELSFYKAIERAGSFIHRENKMPAPLILMSCNPANNWVKKKIFDLYMNRLDEQGKVQKLPDNWLYIPAKITDNYSVPQSYLDSLKILPKYLYEVYVNGDWDVQLKVGGEYFKCFDYDRHTRRQFQEDCPRYNALLPLHISWDDNVNPYLPVGIFQIEINPDIDGTKRFRVCMIDEIVGVNPSNTTHAVCKEIIRKYQGHTSGMYVYGDATADKEDTKLEKGFSFYRLIQDDLKQFKPTMAVMRSNPAVYMRANWMNTVFEKQVGNLQIVIAENCKTAINDFILTKEDENGGKNKKTITDPQTKVSYQPNGHFCDLLEYFMCSKFASQFARWQAGGAVNSITYGRNTHSKNSYK
jgi:hypothetical protein